ncbi:MAG: BRO family protein [Spirochaetales bacterium]|nr:BRO family protein [Spirochaetales bacterium]
MNIQIFDFKGNEVREITDINGNPWFVAKDICQILGYTNPSKAISDHVDSDDKLNNESLSSLGQRGGWIVNESGLYSLILRSQLPSAKAFKKWVTSEVLPAIRKNGGYLSSSVDFTDPDNIQRLLNAWKEDRKKLEVAQPKAAFTDAVLRDKHTHFSITEASKHFGMLRKQLFDLLRKNGLLLEDNTPSQKALREEVLTYRLNPGINGLNRSQSVFTSDNLFNFHKRYLNDGGQLELIPGA